MELDGKTSKARISRKLSHERYNRWTHYSTGWSDDEIWCKEIEKAARKYGTTKEKLEEFFRTGRR